MLQIIIKVIKMIKIIIKISTEIIKTISKDWKCLIVFFIRKKVFYQKCF